MKNKVFYYSLCFLKHISIITLSPIIIMFLHSILIGFVLNIYDSLIHFCAIIITLILLYDFHKPKNNKIILTAIDLISIAIMYTVFCYNQNYFSHTFTITDRVTEDVYSSYTMFLIFYGLTALFFEWIVKKYHFQIEIKKLNIFTTKKILIFILVLSILSMFRNCVTFSKSDIVEERIEKHISDKNENFSIEYVYSETNSLYSIFKKNAIVDLIGIFQTELKNNFNRKNIIQNIKLLFIYSLFNEDFKGLKDFKDYHTDYLNNSNREEILIYYSTFLHNTAGEYFDLTRIDSIYSVYLEIPDIKFYVKENVKKEKSLKIMKNFAGKLSRLEPYLLLGYVYLIDLNYQERNIEEASNYYYKIENLKIPSYYDDETKLEMKSKIDKIKEIYKPLLNE